MIAEQRAPTITVQILENHLKHYLQKIEDALEAKDYSKAKE
jgi:hypothetical protein